MVSRILKIWKRKPKDVIMNDSPVSEPVVQNENDSTGAKWRVLKNYELFEAILLNLPSSELRKARFVGREWNAMIIRSQPLNTQWQWFERKKMRLMKVGLFGDQNIGQEALIREVSHQHQVALQFLTAN